MPEKTKNYDRVIFTPEVIKEVVDVLEKTLPPKKRGVTFASFNITLNPEEAWTHDNEEEFFADYRRGFSQIAFRKVYSIESSIHLFIYREQTSVTVKMARREDVERIFNVLEPHVEECRLQPVPTKMQVEPRVKIFIGHGQDTQWRDLRDHLHDKHGQDVEAYEIAPRGGRTIKEVLEEMLTISSFAALVLTGEDVDAVGGLHARENVIHELGLFQGRLGWRKVVALLEDGVTEFSNIHGLNQIRFAKGNIQATFGEVLATIRREFR